MSRRAAALLTLLGLVDRFPRECPADSFARVFSSTASHGEPLPTLAHLTLSAMSVAPAVPITRLGLIGGSSFLESSALRAFAVEEIATPFGPVLLRVNAERTVVFVQRHAADPTPGKEYSPPHLINYRAIVQALQQIVSQALHTQARSLTLRARLTPQ